jgi:hypothetical protein
MMNTGNPVMEGLGRAGHFPRAHLHNTVLSRAFHILPLGPVFEGKSEACMVARVMGVMGVGVKLLRKVHETHFARGWMDGTLDYNERGLICQHQGHSYAVACEIYAVRQP